jgi:hypothetical protein
MPHIRNHTAGLLRILTAAMLAVHVMVGCCAHHAHACDGQAHSSCSEGVATHDGQCPQGGADHGHHGPGHCQGSQCSFVSSTGPNTHSFARPSLAFVTPLRDEQYFSIGANFGQRFFATGRLLPSVRLHLVNQVLLI